MNRPRKVQLGPYTYTVTAQPEILVDGRSFQGLTEPDQLTITVADQVPMIARVTLLHEVLHAVADLIAWSPPHDDVERLATVLVDTLRRNPTLVSYLTA